MGGICGKPSIIEEEDGCRRRKESKKAKAESFRIKSIASGSLDKRQSCSSTRRVGDDHYEKRREVIPKTIEGEQIAAGWPSWLASVAGEAIHGWLPRRADTFEKLDKIGQGTYSSVYKARDLTNNKIVALKRVRFDNRDSESVKFMAREILILRRLDHPNIIKLEGLVTSHTSCSLYLVFEYMEHDLTGLASIPGVKFTEPQVKCYMQQLLSGLDHCHNRGVLHRDIKGSNLLIDNDGILKIADFGLASFYDDSENVPMTSRVVTLWYRPPELLLGATHYGASVDLWSTGCILGELYAGKPILPGRTEVEQLHKIFKLCGSPSEDYWRKSKLRHSTVFKPTQPYKRRIEETFKDVPSVALRLMETLCAIDPSQRGTASYALNSEFFTTKPHACDPSSLPKYPPSKEIDAKLREEEARRQRAEVKGQKINKESRGGPASDANAELVVSMQKRNDSKSRSEYFTRNKEDTASGFRMEQQRPSKDIPPPMRESYSGPLVAGKKYDNDISITNLSTSKQLETCQDFGHPRKHDRKDLSFGRRHIETGRSSTNGGGNKKIHFSGPLGSSNVDQMLKDHDRHIQEAARRARLEKMRIVKVETTTQITGNPLYMSSRHRAR